MATTTPNFGWAVPTSTDLVKDGAVAIETLGDAIDASLLDLKGGTTNQVLAKNSNTDMDFKWVADASGIPATILDAKGDLIAATAADTASRLAVGANGTVLTADSAEATGLKWAAAASGGALVKISTGTFSSSAAINIDNIFSATYKTYFMNIVVSNPTNAFVNIRYRTGGATNSTTNYKWNYFVASGSATITGGGSTGDNQARLLESNTTDGFTQIWFRNPFQSAETHHYSLGDRGGQPLHDEVMSIFAANTSFDGINIVPSAGSLTGEYEIYGVSL